MAGRTFSAYYDPSSNSINFPATIFQKPFYDKNVSKSQNYGAVGAIIGQEISHAFDSNGVQYDQNGNLNNWWTSEDYQTFEKKTQDLVDQWNELEYGGQNLDGQVLLPNNMTDNGGLSVALEATKKLGDEADLKSFFTAWAGVWASNKSEEYKRFVATNDIHAPKPLRANIQAQNMDESYDAFGITEKNPMFRSKDKRMKIW